MFAGHQRWTRFGNPHLSGVRIAFSWPQLYRPMFVVGGHCALPLSVPLGGSTRCSSRGAYPTPAGILTY